MQIFSNLMTYLVTRCKIVSKLTLLTFFAVVLTPETGSAATGFVKGHVELIRTHNPVFLPSWAPPAFWFSLTGVTSAGSCQGWVTGTILWAQSDKQALTLVLAAQLAGTEIEVAYDDNVLFNGAFCSPLYITTGNPAPTQ